MSNCWSWIGGVAVGVALAAGGVDAREPEIEIRVQFLEVQAEAMRGVGFGIEGDAGGIQSISVPSNAVEALHALEVSGHADLLSAPRLITISGATGTVKVVSEYRYATNVELRQADTNQAGGGGVILVPSDFTTRDVGVTLKACPDYDAAADEVVVQLKTEVVTDPTWKAYTATLEAPDGSKQKVALDQPFFHARSLDVTLRLKNHARAVCGGMITTNERTLEEKRVPVLGAIPWLGRLFRSVREVTTSRRLLITVTANVAAGA